MQRSHYIAAVAVALAACLVPARSAFCAGAAADYERASVSVNVADYASGDIDNNDHDTGLLAGGLNGLHSADTGGVSDTFYQETGNGVATATVSPGILSVLAGANSTSGGYASASVTSQATAELDDFITVNNVNGQLIHMVYTLKIAGFTESTATITGPPPGNGFGVGSVKGVTSEAYSQLRISGTGIPDTIIGENDDSIYLSSTAVTNSVVTPALITESFDVFGNVRTPIFLKLTDSAATDVASGDNFTFQGGESGAFADFSHTVLWGGIQSITYANGDPIDPGWTITSDSGFDYSQPAVEDVPEPSTCALLAIALPGLLRTRRRYR